MDFKLLSSAVNGKAKMDVRLKQLKFQSQHRGFAELDLLLGKFACAKLESLSPAQLDEYEQLLQAQDWDVYGWLVGQIPPPANGPVNIIKTIQDFMNGH
jgi:antitoxin CptB